VSDPEFREHAAELLDAAAHDLDSSQSAKEQRRKSMGSRNRPAPDRRRPNPRGSAHARGASARSGPRRVSGLARQRRPPLGGVDASAFLHDPSRSDQISRSRRRGVDRIRQQLHHPVGPLPRSVPGHSRTRPQKSARRDCTRGSNRAAISLSKRLPSITPGVPERARRWQPA
jgi:hypothetical protein